MNIKNLLLFTTLFLLITPLQGMQQSQKHFFISNYFKKNANLFIGGATVMSLGIYYCYDKSSLNQSYEWIYQLWKSTPGPIKIIGGAFILSQIIKRNIKFHDFIEENFVHNKRINQEENLCKEMTQTMRQVQEAFKLCSQLYSSLNTVSSSHPCGHQRPRQEPVD